MTPLYILFLRAFLKPTFVTKGLSLKIISKYRGRKNSDKSTDHLLFNEGYSASRGMASFVMNLAKKQFTSQKLLQQIKLFSLIKIKKMKEFMLLIRNKTDHLSALSPEQQQQFLKDCMDYIGGLMKEGKLKGAQPLIKDGRILSGSEGAWKEGPFNESNEIIVGYYHILATGMDEAIAIAKGNPEFAYTKTARIEVRPIKMREDSTSFIYPKG